MTKPLPDAAACLDPRAAALFVLSKTGKPTSRPAPGRVQGVATLKIAFDLKVGNAYEARTTQSIPWQRIAAVAMSKLNSTSMVAVLRQALDPDTEVEPIVERAQVLLEPLLESTVKTHAGKVTGSTNIVDVSFDEYDEIPN